MAVVTVATMILALLALSNGVMLEKDIGAARAHSRGKFGVVRKSESAVRSKRAAPAGNCGLGNDTLLEINPYDLSERAESIQAVWVGKDEFVVVASDKTSKGRSTIWRAAPTPYGIFRFNSDRFSISSPVLPDTLQVSPAGTMETVVVVSRDKRFVYVSRNYGKTWDRFKSPTLNFDPTKELYLSTFSPMNMVIRSYEGELYVSSSAGRQWNFITRNVELVEFSEGGESSDLMYYSTTSHSRNFNPLYRMDITNRKTTVLDNSAFRFRVDDHYLFVSRKNLTANKQSDVKSRRLYVSSDYSTSSVHFVEVQLPSLKDQQYYVVMATHESGAFIHVHKDKSDGFGSLYLSDSTGARYSLSLDNHLYTVYNYGLGHYSVHDFYEVKSIRGVYITTQVHPESKGHVTMITFNRGAEWQRLTPPPGYDCPDCSLHLHLRYSQVVSPFYNSTASKGPISIESAPLIIIAHGTVGKERSYSDLNTKVYLSNDGGYTWKDVGLPAGRYVYGIADYGNIIAIAPDSDHVEKIWFSHDRGGCFVERAVDTTKVFELNRGLVFDPSATSLYGFLMGVEGTGQDDEWRIITLNFKSLLGVPCGDRDYAIVEEHKSSCLMGYKSFFKLTKNTSVCYNPKEYDYHLRKTSKCPCSYDDYECEYGFRRASSSKCEQDPAFLLSDVCPPGAATYLQSDSGFVLIPGDQCDGSSDETKDLLKKTSHDCTGHEQDSGFRPRHRNVGLTVFLVIVIIVLSLVLAAIVLFVWLRCRASKSTIRDRVYYQRLPQEEKDKFGAHEDSSSDEELIAAT